MARLRALRTLLSGLRPGDWVTVGLGVCAALGTAFWQPATGFPDMVRVRAGGALVAELDPRLTRRLEVLGPLGTSVIEVANGRARVASDPSPRQLCVRQGWLAQAGEFALCLPNQVSVELLGRQRRHDTIVY
jgi:hypothetical protein